MEVAIACIPTGATVGFKALPTPSLVREYDDAEEDRANEPDWGGIYPQLSFRQAVAYLPNQFERGHDTAYIVKLTAKKPIPVATFSDALFLDGSVAASTKASRVRTVLATTPLALRDNLPLTRACGDREIVLCLPDAEGFELVFPKAMFTQQWLEATSIFTFHESASVPAMVGRVDEVPHLHRSVLLDWDTLTSELESQLHETKAAEVEHLLGLTSPLSLLPSHSL